MKHPIVYLCLILTMGCASKLVATNNTDDKPIAPADGATGKFTNKALADGVTETTVDATQSSEWQRFDLDSGESVEQDADWDLEFSRYLVHSNGGASGEAGVELAVIDGEEFADVSEVPSTGFATDAADGDDDNKEIDNVLIGPPAWYDYNQMTHILKPRAATYVVHSSEGNYFKLHFESYYDDAGSGGVLRFLWARLQP